MKLRWFVAGGIWLLVGWRISWVGATSLAAVILGGWLLRHRFSHLMIVMVGFALIGGSVYQAWPHRSVSPSELTLTQRVDQALNP